MTRHWLIVSRDTPGLDRLAKIRRLTEADRQDYYRVSIECSDPAACPGWVECHEPHEIDGVSAADGPYDCGYEDSVACLLPWCGEDEYEFHGVLHEWRSGNDWTVPYPGCPVVASDFEIPSDVDTAVDGRYEVAADWDEDAIYVTLTPAQDGSQP